MSPPTLSDEVAAIASMGWKITVTTFSRVALAAIPTIFLGRLGTAELAAGALAGVWTSLVQMPTFGVSAALCTLCAQAFGAKNSELVVVWLQLALLVLLTLSVPIMSSLCFVDRLLGFVTDDDQALSLAATYARWLIPSVVPQAVHAALRKFLQAQQIVTPATVVGVASIPVSLILHYILVFGCGPVPALGLVGSPIAQSATALFQAAALAVYTLQNTCKTVRHGWNLEACFRSDRVREFASLAAGVTVQYALDEGVYSATSVIAGRIGPAALAAHSVLASLWQFLFGIFWGLGMPTQVRIAGFLGANEPLYARRSLRVGLTLGFIAAVVTVLVVVTARRQVAAVYTNDPTLASLIEHALPVLSVAALFSGPHVVLVGAVEALALASALVGATLVGSWLVMLPTAYALALSSHYGLNGVWWAAVGGETAKFVLMAATLLRVDWRAESSRAAQRARKVRSESEEKVMLTTTAIQVTNGDMEDGTGYGSTR